MAAVRAVKGAVPWTGQPRTVGTTAYSDDHQATGTGKGKQLWHGPYEEALARRTPEQRAHALAERLDQLRADPPKGYPR